MTDSSQLKTYAIYITDKIHTTALSINNYVTTDSLLPNKQGLVSANSLPAKHCNVIKYKSGDILIANIRPYLKKIWFATNDGGCSSDVLAIRPSKKINPKFLYYALFRDDFFIYAMIGSKGTKMPRGDKKQIMDFLIPDFELKTQKKIADVLSAIDQKIELNNRINAELESMSKTLYDYWFVQFDFPDQNGKPYKSSGGKTVWNDMLRVNLPVHWEVSSFGEYAEVKKGDLITAKDANEGCVKVVAAGIDFSYTHSVANREKNTITISGSGANAGFVNFWREPIFASDCITVRGKTDAETILLFQSLKTLQDHILKQATGSAQPHVYPGDIKKLGIAVPPTKIIFEFQRLVLPLNEQIANNLRQNQVLTALRDWLLPMLMNGQIKAV